MNDPRKSIMDFKASVEMVNSNQYRVEKSFYINRLTHKHKNLEKSKITLHYDNSDKYVVFRKGESYWDFWSEDGDVNISDLTNLLIKQKYITLLGKYNEKKDKQKADNAFLRR